MKATIKLILVAVLLVVPTNTPRADIQQLGPNYFVAGVPTSQFEYFAAPEVAGRQHQANWCWAACVQMVLNYHGLYVRQEQVVQKIFGRQVDAPGTPQQILAALSGWAPDVRGRFSAIRASPYVFQGSDIVQDLAYRWPLIVGVRNPDGSGHAYVLTAVYYSVDAYNRPMFDKVVLRDPWPSNRSKQEWLWRDFQSRVSFAARVYVTRL
jgi:hypothetical protein